jgi:ubiquinone/menaquinone biosynthesis C-methylase UbiE
MTTDHGRQSRTPICDYEGSDYQARFWERGGRAYEDAVEAVALKRLLPPGGKRLLELGAGAGRNTPRYTNFEQVVLLDYSRTQLEQAQQKLGRDPRYVYVAADVYRLPFVPGLFEAATMIRTLHHMAEPQQALGQVRRVLQPGAVFILEFANKLHLKSILRYVLRQQDWNPFTRQTVEFAALNYDFHPAAVREWLAGCGFAIQRQLTVSHFRWAVFKRLIPLGILVKMDALAQGSGRWWQLSPSVFVRAEVRGSEQAQAAGGFFQCLDCGQPLPAGEWGESLACPGCGKAWLCEDGIYDFRE